MQNRVISSFAVRLRDVLATLETTALIGSAGARVRGLGEQLQFACLALPCDEALVALDVATMGRLIVPGVADAAEWRFAPAELLPSGTPFAFLLGGGGGFATELEPGDTLFESLGDEVLATTPRHGLFVPIRVGTSVLGGAALFRTDTPFGDHELSMGERLAEVLSLTVEGFRTERVLLSVFASVLPDLCASDAPTNFADGLESYLHTLRISPDYRRRLKLAEIVGRIAAAGPAETMLVADVLERMERYVSELTAGDTHAGEPEDELLTDELYD